MAATRRKKGRRHPGVVLMKPVPAKRMGWRVRFTDPDTGKVKTPAIPAEHAGTIDQREAYAADKSEWLTARKIELVAGAVPATGQDLEKTIAHYAADHGHLDPRTLKINGVAADKLLAFCKRARLTSADDLTAPVLLKFRAHLISETKRKSKPGGKRGEYISTGERRAPRSINQDIGAAVTVLRYLRKLRLLSRLSYEDIETSMQKLKVEIGRPTFMRPAECRQLLCLALDHDEETFEVTRAENRGDGEKGTTYKHDPIAPFVLFVLVTGMRIAEALPCDWSWIDLDVQAESGKLTGEIHIPAHITKIGRARTVVLDVSGTLRDLLIAMQPDSKLRKGSVFNLSEYQARSALERLQAEGADECWQKMRRTCSTYLTNAPGIFVAASAYRAAKQLGHAVKVAETVYADLVRIPREARTLEAAMTIEPEAAKILRRQQSRTSTKPSKAAKPGAAAAQLN